MECLKDSECWVRAEAINGLSNLVAHRMCYHMSPFDMLSLIIAQLDEAIQIAFIPAIVECLKDSSGRGIVQCACINSLSSLVAHRMCYLLSFDVFNNDYS